MARLLLGSSPTNLGPDPAAGLKLPVFGPARLTASGRAVRLRRKSLAILYYLAVEGATRRQFLADLLWEQVGAAQNLRVELHWLRKTLADFGVKPFERHLDPLVLPAGIELHENGDGGDPFEGLEGLSAPFQSWLEGQRAVVESRGAARLVHQNLVDSVARRIRLPYLLILSAEPDSGQEAFVSALAARLGLPKTEELVGTAPALRYLPSSRRFDDSDARRIVDDRTSLWVVERPRFGEDSSFLLLLRGTQQPGRMSFLELPGLSWRELRNQLAGALEFHEAADLFTRSAGHPGYLRELLDLRRSERPVPAAQVPQRIRAAYQLEARRLSVEARYALERASVHPGPLSDGLLHALDVTTHLIELERRNWLVLDNGWRFKGEVSRSAIYFSLSRGQAQLYHLRAAGHLNSVGRTVAAEYHRTLAGAPTDWPRVSDELSGWAGHLARGRAGIAAPEVPGGRRLSLRDESPILERRIFGERVEAEAGKALIVRQPLAVGESGAEWQLLVPAGVLHLRGRAFVRNALDIGLDGGAVPLEVEFLGRESRSVVFASVERPQQVDERMLLLPLDAELDSYLRFEDSLLVRITSSAEAAVIELTLTVYETSPERGATGVVAF